MKKVINELKYNKKGITLIAVVVTIVVLLILASITINMLFSENGIITKARQAAEETEKAQENETSGMQNMVGQMNELLNPVNKEPEVTLESLMTTVSENNETVEDVYGNKIVVPAGFKIVAHGTDNVEYTYNEENGISTNIPVVQDGIVIQNEEDGNQFVWIPVGELKNKDNTTTTIQLGRYSNFTIAEDGTLPIPVQVASKTEYDTPVAINTYYFEVSSNFTGLTVGETTYKAASEYGNTKAYNLGEWITTTIDNGGYYIARYESSQNGTKAASKAGQSVWVSIAQQDAAIAAKSTYQYTADTKYYSDLINSYAWDTAIIFIQVYSGNTTYATTNNSTSFTTTGTNNDKVCNIHDMSGNVYEWTTETSSKADESDVYPCVHRGGRLYPGDNTVRYSTKYRNGLAVTNDYSYNTFRFILYIN